MSGQFGNFVAGVSNPCVPVLRHSAQPRNNRVSETLAKSSSLTRLFFRTAVEVREYTHGTGWKPVLQLLCLLLAGCASHARAAATTKPAEGVKIIAFADAVELDELTKECEPDLSHQLRLSRGGRIYFGTLNTYDNDDQPTMSVPIIAKREGDNWRAVAIRDARLKDAAWSYVGGGPNRGEIWGVLDASLDADQADLLLAHSSDGGKTFELSALRKPDPAADYDSFCIGPDGKGRVTLYRFPDPEDESASKPGFYHYRTTDGGKTWSSPEFEPDVMWPARDVPDDDQPPTNKSPARKV
jgi:hypothetical protein